MLLQTAVYCGVPAANSAFAVANRVLAPGGRPDRAVLSRADQPDRPRRERR